jgi:hypothetical protein
VPFDRESLADAQIVIIANASSAKNAVSPPLTPAKLREAWQPPFTSAFSPEEITDLREWVEAGGGLLLVFDHAPGPAAIEKLTAAFGIEVTNGHVLDERLNWWKNGQLAPESGAAAFRRANRTLANDPITDGRNPAEFVDLVFFGGGSAFQLPPEGRPLLVLGSSWTSVLPERPFAFEEGDGTPRQNVGGWLQGGVLRAGQGRVAVFADSGFMTTPQELTQTNPQFSGFVTLMLRILQERNPQLLLNVMHWLSGVP